MMKWVYVSIPANRQGISREGVVVADSPNECAEQMAEVNDLPVSATELDNWTLSRTRLEAKNNDNYGRLWRYTSHRLDGPYYIEETVLVEE